MPIKIINDFDTQIFRFRDYEYDNLDLKLIDKNKKNIAFITCSWYKSENSFNIIKTGTFDKVVILANTIEETNYYNDLGYEAIFCNNNAFIDENIFKIIKPIRKQYDMVINSAFGDYKNVKIASKCASTLHIGYYWGSKPYVFPNFGVYANFKNIPIRKFSKRTHKMIIGDDLVKHINSCHIGGIFSPIEGSCKASSEYLLCGLPVVSIKSQGGRDIWYNEHNSIVCENDEMSVYKAMQLAKKKILDGSFNAENIRKNVIIQINEHRDRITQYIVDELFKRNDKNNIDFATIKRLISCDKVMGTY